MVVQPAAVADVEAPEPRARRQDGLDPGVGEGAAAVESEVLQARARRGECEEDLTRYLHAAAEVHLA